MSSQIKDIKLKFACTADWDSMPVVDGVKSCEHCQKKVYDFTGAKQDEFLKILAENNNSICGRFSAAQMGTSHPVLPAWKKWVSAALVLVGINLFNNKVEAQQTKVKLKQHTNLPDKAALLGMVVEKQPHFPSHYDQLASPNGYGDAFRHFLSKNLHYTKGMIDGRVWVSFDVNKNGTLGNFKILRSLSPANDAEVIKVLKLSPKWNPATLKGKPVVSSFTLPISFKR